MKLQLHCLLATLAYCVQSITGNVILTSASSRNIQLAKATDGLNQQTGPECSLRKRKGTGDETIRRYYFDSVTRSCKEFLYKGNRGNLNNFATIDRCNSICICNQPKDQGLGQNKITRYFYNKETDKCQAFRYKGNAGNDNRFLSRQECENICVRDAVLRTCRQRPDFGSDCNNNSTTRYYFDRNCECCRQFIYLGCGGNGNNYKSMESCVEQCEVPKITPVPPTQPPKPDLCYFQPVYGDCNELRTRYYYDNSKKRCVPFTYSGCGGNDNNFLTQFMCKKTCERDGDAANTVDTVTVQDNSKPESIQSKATTIKATSTMSTTTAKTTAKPVPTRCTQRPDQGNCIFSITRYFFDTLTGMCRTFQWSGCGGNTNRFWNRSSCETTCLVS